MIQSRREMSKYQQFHYNQFKYTLVYQCKRIILVFAAINHSETLRTEFIIHNSWNLFYAQKFNSIMFEVQRFPNAYFVDNNNLDLFKLTYGKLIALITSYSLLQFAFSARSCRFSTESNVHEYWFYIFKVFTLIAESHMYKRSINVCRMQWNLLWFSSVLVISPAVYDKVVIFKSCEELVLFHWSLKI